MILAIIGSRDFQDYEFMRSSFESFVKSRGMPEKIVSGGAKGADTLAKQLAEEFKIPFEEFKANWKEFGRAAGPQRNKQIIAAADAVLAFPLRDSIGTRNSISLAKKVGKLYPSTSGNEYGAPPHRLL